VTTQDVDLEKLLSDGTKSYIDQIPIKSKEKFSKALEIVNGNFNLKTCTEVVVMKYIYARSCTRTGNYQDILSGHSKLTEIKDIIQKVKFPAVFYGFALLYKKLNRYEQALEYTEKGLEWFNKGLPCLGYNYPGDDKKIEETDHEFLVVQFEKLRAECKCPPKPEAICRQKHCLEVNKDLHIVPSENIHLNDPDYQGYYTVLCRSNCSLDYHHPCWERQKADYSFLVGKERTPTDKDFFGKQCFTPDCEGLIIKIVIHGSDFYEEPRILQDNKLIERLDAEDKAKKEEDKKKKLLEAKEKTLKYNEHQKLLRRLNKKKSRYSSSSEKEIDDKNVSVSSENVNEYSENVNESNVSDEKKNQEIKSPSIPANFSLNQVTILKRKQEIKEEESNEKKGKNNKKPKERNTIPLGEFNNSEFLGAPWEFLPPEGSTESYDSRIARLAAQKKSYEEYQNYAAGSVVFKSSAKLNPNAEDFQFKFGTVSDFNIAIEDSIKDHVEQILKKYGPLKENDPKISAEFGKEARQLVLERRGLVNFLKGDDRFGSYGIYIFVKGDAEKASKLKNEEEKLRDVDIKKPPSNLGEMARKLREKLEKDESNVESFGLHEAANETSILDSIRRNASDENNSVFGSNSLNTSSETYFTCSTQTDVSSLDLEDLDDPILLKQTNDAMMLELQDSKDKLYKLQNERKMESKQMEEKLDNIKLENSKLVGEIADNKDTIQGMNAAFKETVKREKEMKKTKDQLTNEQQKSVNLAKEIEGAKKRLDQEQRVSFELQQKLSGMMMSHENLVKQLKLKCLKTDYDSKKNFLTGKKNDNEKLIDYLNLLNNRDTHPASALAIKTAIDKLNEYTAKLFRSIDDLDNQYYQKETLLKTSQVSPNNYELMCDISALDCPQLTSVELDTLRLLSSASLSALPPGLPSVSPFSGLPNLARPPPPVPGSRPPGLLAPGPSHSPPGLPPASGAPRITESRPHTGSPSRDLPAPIGSRPRPAPEQQAPLPPRPTKFSAAPGPPGRPAPGAVGGGPGPVLAPPPGLAARAPGGPVSAPAPAPAPAPAGEPAKPKNKANQRLILILLGHFPAMSEEAADGYIQALRSRNNGKLSGLQIPKIIEQVGELWKTDKEAPDNNCSICLEDMEDRAQDSRRLNPCQHRFHNRCIDKWLRSPGGSGNTCPMCRNFIVQEEEFPGLGRAARRS